jgi:hypothetical protein
VGARARQRRHNNGFLFGLKRVHLSAHGIVDRNRRDDRWRFHVGVRQKRELESRAAMAVSEEPGDMFQNDLIATEDSRRSDARIGRTEYRSSPRLQGRHAPGHDSNRRAGSKFSGTGIADTAAASSRCRMTA